MAKPESYMWGERGLVATFFQDVSASDTCDRWQAFLAKIGYSFGDRTIIEAWCVVEPDFSEFGHPDTVFRLTFDNNAKAVFLLEAKLRTFEKASWEERKRNEQHFNSTINGQLELNHRLALALQHFQPGVDTSLAEPDWVPALYSPGSGPRQVKKRAVLRQVVKELAQLEADCYFHVVITTDQEAPWVNVPHEKRPKMFVRDGSDSWDDSRTRLCWANWLLLRELASQWEGNSFCTTYDFFHPNFAGHGPAHENRPAQWSFVQLGEDTVFVTGVREHNSRVVPIELDSQYFPQSFTEDNGTLRPLIPQPQVDKRRLLPERGHTYLWAPPANQNACPKMERRQPTPPVQVKMLDPGRGETSRVVQVRENGSRFGHTFLVYPHHLQRPAQ